MKALLFDLDDTLYPELEFVKSGFRVVANHLGRILRVDAGDVFGRMLRVLERQGRGRIFDTVLQELGAYSPERVSLAVYLYRTHRPTIALHPGALPTLTRLRQAGMCLGLVTDGIALVQLTKVAALGVDRLFDVIVCTEVLGPDDRKPSPVPFQVALDLLEVPPYQAGYVGNDPAKDFPGPQALGMVTIQVTWPGTPGPQGDPLAAAKAMYTVQSLEELLPIVERARP